MGGHVTSWPDRGRAAPLGAEPEGRSENWVGHIDSHAGREFRSGPGIRANALAPGAGGVVVSAMAYGVLGQARSGHQYYSPITYVQPSFPIQTSWTRSAATSMRSPTPYVVFSGLSSLG